jgi:microcystin-dependent protein
MEGYFGEIRFFAPNWAPRNWSICQGQLIAIAQNQVLFSLLGTLYGGDGSTTYALPDLRGRVAVGSGQGSGLSNYQTGQRQGIENVSLNESNMPSHNHGGQYSSGSLAIPVNTTPGDEDEKSSASGVLGNSGSDKYATAGTSGQNYGSAVNVLSSLQTVITGLGAPHENEMPYLVLNPIICIYGMYPSRN